MNVIDKILQVADDEVGYLEKKSNANLDSKTDNAGSNNYTKYWRDTYPQYQGSAWCACFVTWCIDKVLGKDATKDLLGHYPFVYCPTLGAIGSKTNRLYRCIDAIPGDIVLFHNGSEFCHTGIVVSNRNGTLITIEGNTSGGSTVVANGGGVACKSYSHSYIANKKGGTRFYRPNYSKYEEETEMTTEEIKALAKEATAEIINAIGADIEVLNGKVAKCEELLAKRNEQIWEQKCRIDDLERMIDNDGK